MHAVDSTVYIQGRATDLGGAEGHVHGLLQAVDRAHDVTAVGGAADAVLHRADHLPAVLGLVLLDHVPDLAQRDCAGVRARV